MTLSFNPINYHPDMISDHVVINEGANLIDSGPLWFRKSLLPVVSFVVLCCFALRLFWGPIRCVVLGSAFPLQARVPKQPG